MKQLKKLCEPKNVIRLALAVLLLWLVGVPPKAIVVLGPQQHVETINPKMGVHTRLTDEVEEWKIKRTLEMVREMGAPWIVEYFPWAYYEPQKGHFNWEHADIVVDHARRQGLTVIARLGFVPDWARPKGSTVAYLHRASFDDFGEFVYAFVSHFRGRIGHVIIWNEPNLSLEWGYQPASPERYTELLRFAYIQAKRADPGVRILAGALAPTLAPEGSEWGMDDLIFLQGMYDAGAKDYFDVLAVHAYGWKFPPDDSAAVDEVNFARAELLRQVMVRNGDGDKKCIITEGGWNDHPRWTKSVRPGQRIEYTLRAYEKALEEWDWCEGVVLWAFRYPRPARTYQDYYTFVAVDFTPKPIYWKMQEYAQGGEIVE